VGTTDQAPLALKRLEDHLWQAADLFRNKVSNQKDYILALLFFKRASDLYKEETAVALAELGDVANAAQLARDSAFHVLQVPDGHSWDDVRDTDEALQGQALNDALAAIGRANPKQLAGVFERTDFNNKMALPSDDLARIVEHFHKLGPLDSAHVSTDVLGQAYEWLIAKFAAASGKAGGEFYTPGEVGKLIAALLEPDEGARIYDPTCGSGGLLLQCLHRAEGEGVNLRSLFLYGQELNPETWAIARMNMLLHGAGDAAEVKLGDTLATPAFVDGDQVKTFDIVVANPPFSSKNWGHERFKASGDPFGRIKHLPPKSHGEMAFLQHMVASINDKGRLAVVLPNGVFFRGGAELAVRKELIDADLVEAVVQLPADLFYGAGIPACLFVLNRRKEPDRKGRVLMIDSSSGFERRDTKNVLTDDAIMRVADVFESGAESEGLARWVDRDDIVRRRYHLLVATYTTPQHNGAALSVGEAVDAYQKLSASRDDVEARLEESLERLSALAAGEAVFRSLEPRPLHQLVLRIEAGKSPKSLDRAPENGERGVLKVSAIRQGEFRGAEAKAVPDAVTFPAHAAVRNGDVLISRANTRSLVGAVCRVRSEHVNVFLSDKTRHSGLFSTTSLSTPISLFQLWRPQPFASRLKARQRERVTR
jgi:type I restriction enzyme M protein